MDILNTINTVKVSGSSGSSVKKIGHVKSRCQKRPSHHAYRFCYYGSRPSYIMLSSP